MRIAIFLSSLFFYFSYSLAQNQSEKFYFDKEGNKTDSLRASYYSIYQFEDVNRKACMVFSYSMKDVIKSQRHYTDISIYQAGGIAKYYYENGEIKSELNFKKKGFDGEIKTYYQNGNIKRKDIFEDGKFISGNCFTREGKDTLHYDYEIMPQFKGGEQELYKFVREHTVYPKKARRKDITGKVIVGFTVMASGEITKVHLLKVIDPLLDNEALRVVKIMPKWIPGLQDGEPVDVEFIFPFNFNLK